MLINLIKNEFKKQKRTTFYLLVFIIPIFFGLILFPEWKMRGDEYMLTQCIVRDINQWKYLLRESHILFMPTYLPVYISIIMYMIFDIELKNNNWKYTLTAPVEKRNILLSKFILGFIVSSLIVVLNIVAVIISGKLIGLTDDLDLMYFMQVSLYRIIAVAAIVSIQGFITSFYKGIGASVGTAFILCIVSSQFINTEVVINKYNPYSLLMFADGIYKGGTFTITSILICLITVLVVGSFTIRKFEKIDIK